MKRVIHILLLLPVFACMQAYTCSGTSYYVNDASTTGDLFCTNSGNNANNGTSPATPKLTLANLLSTYSAILTAGDVIYLDAGTYNESNIDFAVAGVTFSGAGVDLTIIDHNWAGTNSDFFMYIHANNITLKDMTLQKFENQGTQTPGRSGQVLTIKNATGILIENVIMNMNGESGGNPSISVQANSTVTIRGGGGICNRWQTQYTGGIEVYGASITLNIENYAFAYNFKTGAYDGGGLLIHNANATTTIVNVSNCYFYNNESSDGGGISQRGGVLTVSDCVFEGNMAGQISTPIYGGAVRMTGGTATYKRCRFIDNHVGSAGGTLRGAAIGVYSLDANVDLTIDSCYFSGNTGNEGDDLYADKYSAKTINIHATNTTFSSSADAIYNKDADHIHLYNCGNPSVAGSNTPAVYKENTNATTYSASPAVPNVTGDCATGIVLPVILELFTGSCSGNTVQLYWQTASETNNHFFQIERSSDGINYTPITVVEGNGTTNSISKYSAMDHLPEIGNAYYRLIQFDFNGQFYVHDPIPVYFPCKRSQLDFLNAYVDPSQNLIFFELENPSDQVYELSMFDLTGRLLFRSPVCFSGCKKTSAHIPFALQGIYLYRLYADEQQFNGKIYSGE